MTRGTVSATLVLYVSVAACGGSSAVAPTTPSTPARDSMNSITDLNPVLGTTLQPGQAVTISGTAGFTLATADLGSVMMIIQDQADRPIQSSGVVVVQRGTGDATLTQTITVPSEGVTSIRVYFALAPAGSTSTTAVLRVTYSVR